MEHQIQEQIQKAQSIYQLVNDRIIELKFTISEYERMMGMAEGSLDAKKIRIKRDRLISLLEINVQLLEHLQKNAYNRLH